MGDNQAVNRVRVDSYKTRNRGAFSGSLAALVRFDLWPLLQGQTVVHWLCELSFRWIQICIGLRCVGLVIYTSTVLHNCDISIDSYSPVNKFYSFISFSLLNCLVLILYLYMHFLSLRCYFLYLHYLDTDTALKVSRSVPCSTTSIPHVVENYFPRLWGTDISDAVFFKSFFSRIDCLFTEDF